ncbi:MAG: class I SAM-dependent methyltransferase [Saprospiraceae bacterium]|nr:class I SAM-dependent methyltransferase [Saprospiraceae bacterium]
MGSMRWRIAQAIEIRWWQNYLRKKSPTDYLHWKQDYWLTFLNQLKISRPTGLRILDAGCGPAGIFTVLSGNKVIALDPLLNQYEEKLPHFSKEAYPWVEFRKNTLEHFTGSEKFDLIFCLNVINHVDRWELAIKNLLDQVEAGGTLVLSTDVHRFQFLKRLFRWLPGDILHPQQHDQEDYLSVLRQPGWNWESPIIFKQERIFSYVVFVGKKQLQ